MIYKEQTIIIYFYKTNTTGFGLVVIPLMFASFLAVDWIIYIDDNHQIRHSAYQTMCIIINLVLAGVGLDVDRSAGLWWHPETCYRISHEW